MDKYSFDLREAFFITNVKTSYITTWYWYWYAEVGMQFGMIQTMFTVHQDSSDIHNN